jgi:hypothetical protein
MHSKKLGIHTENKTRLFLPLSLSFFSDFQRLQQPPWSSDPRGNRDLRVHRPLSPPGLDVLG